MRGRSASATTLLRAAGRLASYAAAAAGSHSTASQARPYSRIESMIGTSARPFSVSEYSTRGGTSANVVRSTMPSSSSARRRSERVRGLIPCSERSSSQKRERPSARSRITSSVHLPQITSAVRQTGQVLSEEAMSLHRWYRETSGNEVAGLAAHDAVEQAAGAATATARRHRLDLAFGLLHEDPALAAERHLELLARALAEQVLHLHVGLDRGGHARGPGDRRLRVSERRRLRDVEQHGRTIGQDGHPARPLQRGVV